MGTELPAADAPPAKRPSISSTTTTHATAVDGTIITISSLGQDQLLEIFLRLPNLPALVRAALTCRPWLGAVRSSQSFRRLFRALHPAPLLIGLFIDIDGAAVPSFVPLRRSNPDVIAAVRRGDFLLTSLPVNEDEDTSWCITDCRHGYVLLWNKIVWKNPTVAAVNPMTWAVDVIPVPRDVWAGRSGRRRNFAFLGFHLPSADEKPSSFRVVCVCADKQRVRVAVFSPETRDWAVPPWVHVGGDNSLKSSAGTLVGGSVYWPFHGEGRMIKINTATMDISFVDLPSQIKRCESEKDQLFNFTIATTGCFITDDPVADDDFPDDDFFPDVHDLLDDMAGEDTDPKSSASAAAVQDGYKLVFESNKFVISKYGTFVALCATTDFFVTDAPDSDDDYFPDVDNLLDDLAGEDTDPKSSATAAAVPRRLGTALGGGAAGGVVARCFIHTLMATELDGVAQCRFGVRCGRMDSRRRTTLSVVMVASMAERPGMVDATVQL
ncbi:hypothetical protein TRIUR3_06145 [Triticum urartu]|uniref:F-box domain-containing protein n=1 Tax=Triticum urartu TaxID=4572 RepID=M7ZEA7_TRIUA|nr:hypothetical protein TRIUR3_06145 [Triticum urartu]